MKKSLNLLYAISLLFVSCSGAEKSGPPPIIRERKHDSKQRHVHFYNDPKAFYKSLNPDSKITEQRYNARVKSETKRQSLARGKIIQGKRDLIKKAFIQEKNKELNIYEPAYPLSLLSFSDRLDILRQEDEEDRREKLNTLAKVREIEKELLTEEEMFARREEFNNVSAPLLPVSPFITLDSSSSDQLKPILSERLKYLHKYSSREMHILLTFIVNSLIADNTAALINTITDEEESLLLEKIKRLKKVADADLDKQQRELCNHQVFETKTFKHFLQRYLDENDYSFVKKTEK